MHIFPLNSGFISHADSSAVIRPDFVSVREITASTANTKDASGFLFVALAALKIMFKKKNCSKWYSEAVSLTLGKPQTILRTPLITIAFYWTNNPFLRSQRGLWIIWSDANTVSVRCFRCSFRQGPFTSITLAVEAGISETDLSKVGQTKAKLSCSVRLRENVFFFLSCGCTDPF